MSDVPGDRDRLADFSGPQLTRRQLAQASVQDWAEWLRSGLLAFVGPGSEANRLQAFRPLTIHPSARYPAGDLTREIRLLVGDRVRVPAKACDVVLSSWSPTLDPWQGAMLLIQVATRLGSLGLFDSCVELLRKTESLSSEAVERLISMMVVAAETRFTGEQVIEFGKQIGREGLWTPSLLADYSVVLARQGLEQLPRTILAVAPSIKEPPHTGEYSVPLARRWELEFERTALQTALEPMPDDDATTCRFRQALADEAGLHDGGIDWLDESAELQVQAELRRITEAASAPVPTPSKEKLYPEFFAQWRKEMYDVSRLH
jgi:hypothetical protein